MTWAMWCCMAVVALLGTGIVILKGYEDYRKTTWHDVAGCISAAIAFLSIGAAIGAALAP